jgi:hypothetical protein
MKHDFLQKVTDSEDHAFKYSICTLTTRIAEYEEMVSSFLDAGFTATDCEFLYIDNSQENYKDAYEGINLLISRSIGQYIILCHQDVLINKDKREDLDNRLKELEQLDSTWAICGNGGAAGPNYIVYHISYPGDVFKHKGKFPLKVSGLDENFLVIKKKAMLAQSIDLKGFHLYATDLCLNAESRGFSSYAIAFNLTHKSYGKVDESFFLLRKEFIKKYDYLFRNRWIQTPSTVFHLSGSALRWLYANPASLFIVRMLNGLKKRMK